MVYVGEWKPGVLEALIAERVARAGHANRSALAAVARSVETETKTVLARTTHPYGGWGTRTSASPGGPPALVSGMLQRSITHTPVVLDATGLFTRVGTGVGFYPWYGKGRTPSSLYGKYLETGLRNGATYPFLQPTADRVMRTTSATIWAAYFRTEVG